MTDAEKVAKIDRAEKLAKKLARATNEHELNAIVQEILYALVSRLDYKSRLEFEGYFHDANYIPQFDLQITTLLSIVDKYKEFIGRQ